MYIRVASNKCNTGNKRGSRISKTSAVGNGLRSAMGRRRGPYAHRRITVLHSLVPSSTFEFEAHTGLRPISISKRCGRRRFSPYVRFLSGSVYPRTCRILLLHLDARGLGKPEQQYLCRSLSPILRAMSAKRARKQL